MVGTKSAHSQMVDGYEEEAIEFILASTNLLEDSEKRFIDNAVRTKNGDLWLHNAIFPEIKENMVSIICMRVLFLDLAKF